MIFIIPFPTIVETPKQENQKIINGGNYVKNILAFFILIAFYTVVKEKRWREYLLIGTFTVGYLAVLAMSAFAQAERFHQPVLPFEIIIAAYGISLITNKEKKYFTWWMVLIFVIIVAWSWFKLAGRGMA
jgi:phosphoglycerol transferase MdoB-like AlkP superfamily enzyme